MLFYNRLKFVSEKSVVELDLKTLPDLHETIPPLLLIKNKFLPNIVPGDVININSLKSLTSLIEADNILVEVHDHDIPQFTASNFTNCDKFNKDDPVELKIAPYGLHPDYFTELFYKFDVVNEVAKRRHYGVDPKYLNNRYKCLKVKICSGLKRTKLIISSVYVVNLDKNDTDKVRIFDSKNVVLCHKLGNETHYVTRTEKGNCLFQALIYENLDDSLHSKQIKGPLLFRGKILSANNDKNLEEWAEEFVNDFSIESYKTLAELSKYQMALQAFNSKLSQ
ncbi:hypothetical protein KQX54_010682 [Cotesia glomerata]|uniref:Uncharacterized protein n=1 Tax=Cotesia glomerata TaxID=32391 RepID=A0AAV7J958_COTGL|nr:hypothetical protein KQX54_010682 [Cotesia glomerata]